jgi:hypothetical protein
MLSAFHPPALLRPVVTAAVTGVWLFGGCRGVDPSPVVASGPPKTISVEDSFKRCSNWDQVGSVLQVRYDMLMCVKMHSTLIDCLARVQTLVT